MEQSSYKPGFAGHDAMREKAKRIFDGEMHTIPMEKPMSASAPSKTPMRKYKKGGSVTAMPHANDMHLKKGGSAKKTSVLRQAVKGRTKKKESMAKMDADMDKAQKPIMAKKAGGKVSCYKKGGLVKMAAGGVAKIRHRVATKEGLPINKKVVKGK